MIICALISDIDTFLTLRGMESRAAAFMKKKYEKKVEIRKNVIKRERKRERERKKARKK